MFKSGVCLQLAITFVTIWYWGWTYADQNETVINNWCEIIVSYSDVSPSFQHEQQQTTIRTISKNIYFILVSFFWNHNCRSFSFLLCKWCAVSTFFVWFLLLLLCVCVRACVRACECVCVFLFHSSFFFPSRGTCHKLKRFCLQACT